MANSEEKVSKFVQAITQYAQDQKEKIHQEVEDFKSEKLLKAEQEVLRDSYSLIQKERMELQGDMSREMSRRDLAARKDLLALRRDMMLQVFGDAENKLTAFCSTPDYLDYLKKSMEELSGVLPAQGTTYEVCRRDEALLPRLRELCPAGSRVELTDDIRLGGIRGHNPSAGLMADDTLDARLEDQKDWFIAHAGLTID